MNESLGVDEGTFTEVGVVLVEVNDWSTVEVDVNVLDELVVVCGLATVEGMKDEVDVDEMVSVGVCAEVVLDSIFVDSLFVGPFVDVGIGPCDCCDEVWKACEESSTSVIE